MKTATYQSHEVNKFGEEIFERVEQILIDSIVEHLGTSRNFEQKDANGDVVPKTFGDLFHELVGAGFYIDHDVSDDGNFLRVYIYQKTVTKQYALESRFSFSATECVEDV